MFLLDTDTSIIMPPFFGDDEFSFLDTYRVRSNDEDESDNEGSQTSSSSSVSENNDEQEFVYTSCATSFDLPKLLLHMVLRWGGRKIAMTMTRMMSRLLGEGRRQKGT